MSDPTPANQELTVAEVSAAGLDDWRQTLNQLRARFGTGDFATGLKLVNRIGEAAESANHHPDITLTYSEVLVSLVSHDVDAITRRDVDLARRISDLAHEIGAQADVSGLTQLDLGLDTDNSAANASIYAALLGVEVRNGEPYDPSGQVPTIWWQGPDGESTLPAQDFDQRWHLDVWVPIDEGERRLQAVLDAGGTLVSSDRAPSFWVIEDADGNRSCICTVADRD